MNPAILELHAIRQVGDHCPLHLSVCGVSSPGEERFFEILVDTGGSGEPGAQGTAEVPPPAAQRCTCHPQSGQW